MFACGGGGASDPGAPAQICNCTPPAKSVNEYRHAAKHVPLPNKTPIETTISDILAWPQPAAPAHDAPRAGRELNVYHIATAYIQLVWLVNSDCDVHLELSDTPDKATPRIIAETPVDPEYCTARQEVAQQLENRGIHITTTKQEIANPPKVSVLGMAFEDDPHSTRGSGFVKTLWELHPAVVSFPSQ